MHMVAYKPVLVQPMQDDDDSPTHEKNVQSTLILKFGMHIGGKNISHQLKTRDPHN